jgi:hypothetical protein
MGMSAVQWRSFGFLCCGYFVSRVLRDGYFAFRGFGKRFCFSGFERRFLCSQAVCACGRSLFFLRFREVFCLAFLALTGHVWFGRVMSDWA